MKTVDVVCELECEVFCPTLFLINVAAVNDLLQQVVTEKIECAPSLNWEEVKESSYPNRTLRLNVFPGEFRVCYTATVTVSLPIQKSHGRELPVGELPVETLRFLGSSPLCQSERLFNFACHQFAASDAGESRVFAICQWIRENLQYSPEAATLGHTASEVLTRRVGSARDFSQVGIALCRALNIPARYVTGYVPTSSGAADFHAVFEAFHDDGWQIFDPTGIAATAPFVRTATGWDACDVPVATTFGALAVHGQRHFIQVVASKTDAMTPEVPNRHLLAA